MEEQKKKEEKRHLIYKGLAVVGLFGLGIWLHKKAGKINSELNEKVTKVDTELEKITGRINVLEGKIQGGINTNEAIWREIARKRGRKDLLS